MIKTDILDTEISNQIPKKINQTQIVNFWNSKYFKYSKVKAYYFSYHDKSAVSIIEFWQRNINSYELVLFEYFENDLNFHFSIQNLEEYLIKLKFNFTEEQTEEKFVSFILEDFKFTELNLIQRAYFETLQISTCSYKDGIISAIYF